MSAIGSDNNTARRRHGRQCIRSRVRFLLITTDRSHEAAKEAAFTISSRYRHRRVRGSRIVIQVPVSATQGANRAEISIYVTTGETDFLLISEANEAEAVIAALMASSAAGMISNVSTARAWTGAEFKGIADRAAKAAKAYRPPGKK